MKKFFFCSNYYYLNKNFFIHMYMYNIYNYIYIYIFLYLKIYFYYKFCNIVYFNCNKYIIIKIIFKKVF